MNTRETRDRYADFLDCLEILRRRTDAHLVAELLAWIGYALSQADLKQIVRYLLRRRKIAREGDAPKATLRLLTAEATDDILEQKMRFSREPWTGGWCIVTYDVPVEHNRLRMHLTRKLHEMGFAPLCASSWVSPYDWSDFLETLMEEWSHGGDLFCVRSSRIVRLASPDPFAPSNLWELQDLHREYSTLAKRCENATRLRGRTPHARRAQTALWALRRMRLLATQDPMLPAALLPSDWPRPHAVRSLEKLKSKIADDLSRAVPSPQGAH